MDGRLYTVVETPTYLADATAFLSETEREEIVNRVAANPTEGVSLGGGIRKMRVKLPGRGRRGGARIVFLFGGDQMPIILLAAFRKNEKAGLTPKERQALVDIGRRLSAGDGGLK
ncbi:type II toxin-antitoxin system RelE/ParE family toxin [Candidatus Poriferisodalis sp.]|uniref:type II toxin-antitoxin system RelE/ParE family toxin n=1 Tax=Candidatus Poriferisodalis sp. TaxID=3101277 RepID=UPI003B02C7F9